MSTREKRRAQCRVYGGGAGEGSTGTAYVKKKGEKATRSGGTRLFLRIGGRRHSGDIF